MKSFSSLLATSLTLFSLSFSSFVAAEELSKEQSEVLKKKIELVKVIASDSKVVEAVKTGAPAEYKEMTQDKWKEIPVLDPKVRYFSKTPAAEVFKAKKDESMAELFLSAADGTKVAFLSKTSNWSHKGKPKHDVPMTGKEWTGKIEIDESTGSQNIQVAVPVLDGGKPIGSLVVGFSVSKLK